MTAENIQFVVNIFLAAMMGSATIAISITANRLVKFQTRLMELQTY